MCLPRLSGRACRFVPPEEREILTASEIASRLASVRDRVAQAAARSGRKQSAVRLVLASKTQPPEAIRAAYAAGARDFGENYVQEADAKRTALADLPGLRWHLIGHLQTNKARTAAAIFDLIHSLDSERLARALAHASPERRVRVLIEINLGGEASKTGIAPDGVERLLESAREQVEILGLMAIPPQAAGAEDASACFAAMRRLRDQLAARSGLALSELSMGMSADFETAIEQGATIVRVGRAVFGERTQ
jgi:pyridoxal phosphate enzyme (YggS family)